MELSKVKTYDNDVESNLDGDQYKIEADAEFFNHLSKRIYTDSQLAIVRELMCNAWDAQVEGGNAQDPIIVHCPNVLEPVLKVIDTGIGMDLQTLKDIYSTYGKSTKRHNMDTTGGLGVGSKTPFAYTDSFTVYSVKDGMKHTMVNYKEKGIPKIKEIFSVPTDEPNGVAVHVPIRVDDFSVFKTRIEAMATVFHGNVKVTGIKNYDFQENNIYKNESLRKVFKVDDYIVDPNLFTVESYRVSRFTSSKLLVLMGNVPYQLDLNKLDLDGNLRRLINDDIAQEYNRVVCFEVPVGSLDFSMSREHLEYSDRTIDVLRNTITSWYNSIISYGETRLAAVTNDYERFQLEQALHDSCPSVFPNASKEWMRFCILRKSRGLENIRRADYGEFITTKVTASQRVLNYSDHVPDEGDFDFHIVTYQNRLYKRKRITKLCQDNPSIARCVTSLHGYGGKSSNSSVVVLNCTVEQGERLKSVVEQNVSQFGDHVKVHLHHLADIEVEKDPTESKPKNLGSILKQRYDDTERKTVIRKGYGVNTVELNDQMEKGSHLYAWVASDNRAIDHSNTRFSEKQLHTIIEFLNDTALGGSCFGEYTYGENNDNTSYVTARLLLVNKTSSNLIGNYENLIHLDLFIDEYRNAIDKHITKFIKKHRDMILQKISSSRTKRRCGYDISEYGFDWGKFEDRFDLITKMMNVLKLPPIDKHSLLYKTIRLNSYNDRLEAREEYVAKKSTHLGQLEILEDKVSFQLKMFKEFSKKRSEKYRYAKRIKGASNEN